MQNTCFHGLRNFAAKFSAQTLVLSCAICALACALVLGVFAPSAYAASYSCPSTTIKADVTQNGDLHVVETRQFSFPANSNYVAWNFENLTSNGTLRIDDITIRRDVDDSNSKVASRKQLSEVPYRPAYPHQTQPEVNTFAVDYAYNWLYAFFDADAEDVEVVLEYTIVNGVALYKDVAQVYWRYVVGCWPVESNNVKATFTLPVPKGAKVVQDDNVNAWGHGPLDGTINLTDEGAVVYQCPTVNARQFAEARIIFPVRWITNPSESSVALHENVAYRDSAIKSELKWADQSNWLQVQAVTLVAIAFVLAMLVLLWAAIMLRRWGIEHKPTVANLAAFQMPFDGDRPALASRLIYWNKGDDQELFLVIASLISKGIIQVRKGQVQAGSQSYDGIYLASNNKGGEEPAISNLENLVMGYLFNKVSQGKDSLWVRQIDAFPHRSPQLYGEFRQTFDKMLAQEVEDAQLFEQKSDSRKNLMRIVAAAYLLVSVGYAVAIVNPIPLVGVLVSCALMLMSHFMSRRSQVGADEYAVATLLRAQLQGLKDADASELPKDAATWSKLLIHAYLLEVADEALQGMQAKLPELFAQSDADSQDDSDTQASAADFADTQAFQMLVLAVQDRLGM